MPLYHRETRVRAPLEEVWAFYSTAGGLVALTPDWMGLRVEGVDLPPDAAAGAPDDPAERDLVEGARVHLSVRPFGVGPRRSWTSVIVERTVGPDGARFADEMVTGPFPRWVHTHRFRPADEGTVVSDRVEYRLPGGALAGAVGRLARLALEPTFRHRHRRTRELLERR